MANEKESFEKDPSPISKGLNQDNNEEFQPEGTYRFALNAVLTSDISERVSIINEEGNSNCLQIATSTNESPALIGKCLLPDGSVILFIDYFNRSVIGIQYEDCTFKELIVSECLGFNRCQPIDCTAKIHGGCDRIIYFTDDKTKYKSINLDKLQRYYKAGFVGNPNVPNINGEYGWDCSLFNFNPDFKVPVIQLKNIGRGGRLRIGAYIIAFRYLDDGLNDLNWSTPTNPIYITEPSQNKDKQYNHGGLLKPENDGYIYANKSFTISLTNMDLRYKYFQIAIMEFTQGTDTNNLTYLSKTYSVKANTDITISELIPANGFVEYDTNSIVIPNVYLDVVKAHTQVDNRLIVANLQNDVTDWSVFQQKANDIQAEYFTYKRLITDKFSNCNATEPVTISNVNDNDPFGSIIDNTTTGYDESVFLFDFKTFMRDEVYAIGIVFLFKNGKVSPVFHIPGRTIIDDNTGQTVTIDGTLYNESLGISQWGGIYDRFGNQPTSPNDSFNCNLGAGVRGWDTYGYNTANTAWTVLDKNTFTQSDLSNTTITSSQYYQYVCSDLLRWKFLNTSIRANKTYPFNVANSNSVYTNNGITYEIYSSGAMAYFDTGTPYPDNKDCDGNRIFPEGNIRHHRFPDSRKEPIFTGGWFNKNLQSIFPVGIKLSNIVIPDEYKNELQGYYIVRGDREGNKTVIDKGWLNVTYDTEFNTDIRGNLFWLAAYHVPLIASPRNGYNVIEFVSPKTQFGNVQLQGTHYKLENTIVCSPVGNVNGTHANNNTDNNNASYKLDGPGSFGFYGYCETMTMRLPRIADVNASDNFGLLHTLPILTSEYALYNQNNTAAMNIASKIINDNHRQTTYLSKIYEPIVPNPVNYHLYRMAVPFSDGIIDINKYASNKLVDSISVDLTGFASNNFNQNYGLHIYYAAIKSDIVPYTRLEDITYIKIHSNPIVITDISYPNKAYLSGGDCFISRMHLNKYYYKDCDTNTENNSSSNYTSAKMSGTLLMGFVESEINATFRNKNIGDDYYLYPWNSFDETLKVGIQELHLGFRDFLEILHRYRLDYSADNVLRKNLSLSDANEYCSTCSEKFPNTIRYSGNSLTSQLPDYYRKFAENNVQEVPTDTGEITNIFVKDSSLMVHTKGSLYRYNLAPQELETNNDVVKIGSGSLGTAKPQKLFDNQQGFSRGGTEFKHASVFCDDVYIWIDNISKKIFSITNQVEEISAAGLQRWFKTNLELVLRQQFRSLPMINNTIDYPVLNTICENSIGFSAVYDPEYKRYILTKKDYKLTSTFIENLLYDSYAGNPPVGLNPYQIGLLYYNINGFYVANSTSTLKPYSLDSSDNNLVENLSWTISYSLLDKAWVSWHSYRPNFMYNNNKDFFTYSVYAPYNLYIWKHNMKKYFQTYYNNKFDFIIDYVYKSKNAYTDYTFSTVEYSSNVYAFNEDKKHWVEKQFVTFDKLYCYNNNQITGLKEIVANNLLNYGRPEFFHDSVTANKDRNIWKINQLRDYSINRLDNIANNSMFSNDIFDTSIYYSPSLGYIDKVINTNYIDLTKNPYKLERLTDKYMSMRLFFKPEEDYKIVLNMLAGLKQQRV